MYLMVDIYRAIMDNCIIVLSRKSRGKYMNDIVEVEKPAPHVRDAYMKVRQGQYVFYGNSSYYDEVLKHLAVNQQPLQQWADFIIDTRQNTVLKCRVDIERAIDRALGIPRNGQ